MNKQTAEATKKVTDRILSQLEAGNLPPWSSGRNELLTRPYNVASRRYYRGLNHLILSSSGHTHNIWGTFNNWQKLNTTIKRGEVGTYVIAWKRNSYPQVVVDAEGNEETRTRNFWCMYHHVVFNIGQTSMTDEQIAKLLPSITPSSSEDYPEAEALITDYITRAGVGMVYNNSDTPHYKITKDMISMPGREVYESLDRFVSTLAHEAAHSTGAKSRLNREIANSFGDEKYAFEELVAECAASIFCSMTGIVNSRLIENQAAYIENWLKVLKNNPSWVITAAGLAQKAVDLILLDTK